jgi:hypothetical protein
MALPRKSKSDPSELKIALDNRAFEIQLFWQRSNYFLVLMTALGIGAFSVKDVWLSPLIAVFATAASFFWFRTNLGSKFWQESWEVEVTQLSKEQVVRSFEKGIADVTAQVSDSLGIGKSGDDRSWLRRWVDRQTARKPSVTYNMILLSLLSTVVWAVVTAAFSWRLAEHVCGSQRGGPSCFSAAQQQAIQSGPARAMANTSATQSRPSPAPTSNSTIGSSQ